MPSGAAIKSAPAEVTRVPKIVAPPPKIVEPFQVSWKRKPTPYLDIAGTAPWTIW